MSDNTGHPFLRHGRMNSYAAYSIGCGVAWAALLAIAGTVAGKQTFDRILLFFGGWVVGWTSATIARLVYPPPRKRPETGPTSFFQGFREQ